jgi:hypothetical protein
VEPNKHGLGRLPSKFDPRDYNLSDYIPKKAEIQPTKPVRKVWDFLSLPLDQESTGHCVGFSIADWGICLPIQDNYTNQDGHDFYYKAKVVDGEPKTENGSSVRTAAKVLQQEGKISSYAFASNMNEIKYWVLNNGPVIVGTTWTQDMFSPDENGVVHPTGDIVGGHAYLLNEFYPNYLGQDCFGFQNSWDGWGLNSSGKFYISVEEFNKLFIYNGEAMAATELSNLPSTTSQPWWVILLRLFGINI